MATVRVSVFVIVLLQRINSRCYKGTKILRTRKDVVSFLSPADLIIPLFNSVYSFLSICPTGKLNHTS